MVIIIVLLGFTTVYMFLYGILYSLNKDKMILQERMAKVRDLDKIRVSHESNDSFSRRAFGPLSDGMSKMIKKFSPTHQINKVNKKLETAGLNGQFTYERWVIFHVFITIVMSAFFIGIAFFAEESTFNIVLYGGVGIFAAQVGLRYYVSSRITKKKKNIVKDLPFVLDLITVSVEAGLSFDGAIARVIMTVPGYLSDEFAKTLKEMKMGIERKIALRNMSNRNDIKELSMLITSLIQADSLGVSLGNVLRIESEQLRDTRKQVAREKAMKAPVKILIPLILFIFPSIFVIILGPAIINMMEMFAQ